MRNVLRLLIVVLFFPFCSGCMTSGIIERPDLKQLSYDGKGVLKYDGKEAEIRYVLPWYQDMWPDSVSEWGFTLFTAGAVGVAVGGSRDGGGGSGGSEESTTPTTTTTSGGGGGGGDTTPPPSAPPPLDGGGIEEP